MYPSTSLTAERLIAAGWHCTTEHASSCYGMPVLVSPDGNAIGDADLVCLLPDGTLCEDLCEGRLVSGRTLRQAIAGVSNQRPPGGEP